MKLAIELGQLADNAVLKAQPQHVLRAPEAAHPRGANWWCQWWEAIPEDAS